VTEAAVVTARTKPKPEAARAARKKTTKAAKPDNPYRDFLLAKTQLGGEHGFKPVWMPDEAMLFQSYLMDWSVRRGRAGVFAGCGLGKSVIALTFAENVVRHANKPVLYLVPLAVAPQMVREGEKFGIDVVRSRDGKFPAGSRVVVTNYERLDKFSPSDFAGCVAGESGCLKDFNSKRKAEVTEFMRTLPYRLLETATPAPNDYIEFGTSSECLGELGRIEMLQRFFKSKNNTYTGNDSRGPAIARNNRHFRDHWFFKPHAERHFWRWVCSWARACEKPSDLGDYDDSPFRLPPLEVVEHEVKANRPAPGRLFDVPAETLAEQREEARRTLRERCEKVAELVKDATTSRPAAAWCNLNDEGDLLAEIIPGAEQIRGSDPDERKEELWDAFVKKQVRVIISKPRMGGWGLNLQVCSHLTYFPSHSFEAWHQVFHRFHRFGQKRRVRCDVVITEGQYGVRANLERKQQQCERAFAQLVSLMNDGLRLSRAAYGDEKVKLPSWL
jgi:hypothetical protein